MIQFLIFLTIYESEVETTTTNGFKKYRLFNFGFKKDSQYTIEVSNAETSMVFGLATKEEIASIEKLPQDQEYCNGSFTLSQIQAHVFSGKSQSLNGTIQTKGIYTPYTYGCKKNYDFHLKLNFLNGKYHRNYLYDIGPIYSIVYGILDFIVFIIFLIFCFFYVKTKNEYVTFLIILFCLTFAQSLISFFLFEVACNYEYLYYSPKLKYFQLANELIIFASLVLYLILSVKLKNMNDRFSGEQLLIAIGVAFFSMVLDLIIFFIEMKDKYALGISSFIFLGVYNYFIIKLSLHTIAKFSRIAILTFSIGICLMNLLNNSVFYLTNETFSIPIWLITMNILFLSISLFSDFFLMIAYTVGREFEFKGRVIKSIYVNTYTNSIANSEAPMLPQ